MSPRRASAREVPLKLSRRAVLSAAALALAPARGWAREGSEQSAAAEDLVARCMIIGFGGADESSREFQELLALVRARPSAALSTSEETSEMPPLCGE